MEAIHNKFKLNIYCQSLKLIHIPIKYKSINFNTEELYRNENGKGHDSGNRYGDGSGYGDGYGYGEGIGYGDGSGNGYGNRNGYGYGGGRGNGCGDGSGDGYGYGSEWIMTIILNKLNLIQNNEIINKLKD